MDKHTRDVVNKARRLMEIEKSYAPFSQFFQNLAEELETGIVKLPREEIEKLRSAYRLELELRHLLAETPTLIIHDHKVNAFLGTINSRDGETEFRSRLLMAAQRAGKLADDYATDFDPGDADISYYDEWMEKLFNLIDPVSFRERTEEIGTPVVGQRVPAFLDRQLDRVKNCYRLGLDEVAVVFCRAILEAALAEALRRVGELKCVQGKTVDLSAWKLGELIRISKKNPTLRKRLKRPERIEEIKNDASRILHSKELKETQLSSSVEEIIKDTYSIVGEIFA